MGVSRTRQFTAAENAVATLRNGTIVRARDTGGLYLHDGITVGGILIGTGTPDPDGGDTISWPSGSAFLSPWNIYQTPDESGTWTGFSTSSPDFDTRVFQTNRWGRVPCHMDIQAFRMRVYNGHLFTGLYFELWRRDTGADTYTRITSSANLVGQMPSSETVQEFTLATPISAQTDDIPCVRATSASAQAFTKTLSNANVSDGSHILANPPAGFTGVTLTARASNQCYPIGLKGMIPHIAVYGDSQAEGERGFDEDSGSRRTCAHHLTAISGGYRFLHRGIGSQSSAQILARLGAYSGAVGVTDLGIPMCVCPGGFGLGNNVMNIADPGDSGLVASAKADYFDDVVTFLDTYVTTGGGFVVMCACNPGNGYTDVQCGIRRDWNVSLAALCATYPANRVLFINMDVTLGQTRGSTGELDDFKTGYNVDLYHMTTVGDAAMCQKIWDDFEAWATLHNISY